MASGEPGEGGESHGARVPASVEQGGPSHEDESLSSELGDASFPVSVRGYDRAAVDAYVSRVKRVVTQLEATRSPEVAVRHALERVGEQTKGMLEQAGATVEAITAAARSDAEESTARARSEAEEIVAKAKAEAAEVVARSRSEAQATVTQAQKEAAEQLHRSREEVAARRTEAEARLRELRADTESIRKERGRLLENIRQIATHVDEVASAADARFPRPETAEQAEERLLETETVRDVDATDAPVTEKPTAGDRDPPA